MGRWILAIVFLLGLMSPVIVMVSARVAVAASQAPAQADSAARTGGAAYLNEDGALNLRDYDEPRRAVETPLWQTVLSILFKLLLVVGLMVLSMGVFRNYFQGRLKLPSLRGKSVVLLESTMLSPQHTVHLVSLGGERLLLLGASASGLSLLSEVTDPQMVTHLIASQQERDQRFGRVLDMQEAVQAEPGEPKGFRDGSGRGTSHEWEG